MISQLTVDVSAALFELITKLFESTIVPTDKAPCVPPGVLGLRKIKDAVFTAVVDIVIDPAVIAADTPQDALAPVLIESLFPAVFSTRFPFVAVKLPAVAVTPPVVAVKPVPAVIAPVDPTVVPTIVFGATEPIAPGDAKLAPAPIYEAVAGEMYTSFNTAAEASALVAALTSVGCVLGFPVTPGG